jgi:exonuclease SbcC
VNRGVVRLVFDAGGKRYVALRDVRRSGGRNPTVGIHEARLERLVNPDALGDTDDEVEVLAIGRDVNGAVENILGLNFGQFTQSVALPQGDFARFLHATDAERQAILKNLLGYHVYERVQQVANGRAADARTRADTLTEQLVQFADATAEHVDAQRRTLEGLVALREHMTSAALPALRSAFEAANAARSALEKSSSEREQLRAIAKPDDVDTLGAQKQTAAARLESAESVQRKIEQQDNEIRTTLKSLRPRHEFERMLSQWQELGDIGIRLPDLAKAADAAQTALAVANTDRDTTQAAARTARDAADAARQRATECSRHLETAQAHLSLVAELRAPDDINDIADGLRQSAESLADARSRLTDSETAQQAAVAELDALPDSAVLSAADGAAGQIQDIVAQDIADAPQCATAQRAAESGRVAAESCAELLAAAEQALHEALNANQAAALRTDLHSGDDCPVCGQLITEIPSSTAEPDLEAARTSARQAKDAAAEATAEANRLDREHQALVTVRTERWKQCESARLTLAKQLKVLGMGESLPALDNPIDPDSSEALAHAVAAARGLIADATRKRLETEAGRRDADAAVSAARASVQEAEKALQTAHHASREAHKAIHTARDTVSALNPPRVDDADVGGAWQQFATWAGEQRDSLQEQIESLVPQAAAAVTGAEEAQQQLKVAEGDAQVSQSAATKAALAQQQADTQLTSTRTRQAELTRALAEAPSHDDTATQLEQVKTLEQQADAVGSQLLKARAATGNARTAVADADRAIATSWERLRRVRDPLAALGAPELTGTNLLDNWDLLVSWAATEAQARSSAITAAERELQKADERAASEAERLTAELAKHSVQIAAGVSPAELADQAPATVSAAVASAESAVSYAEKRLRQSENMHADMRSARESAEVAGELSRLMRANQFPRWLIAGALDALLLDASAILFELSGGQFELTRDENNLLVIDHNDADMSRPVKTLSGGETFQASLALALALSEQVTALSAEGASKLESIFLDEGFGTLDEATLDVVAGTLENLAASGSRMVGVITHVSALADRIPVRFQVNRDGAGSHIERSSV